MIFISTGMGSDMSITSSRRPQFGRSNSRYSSHMSHGVSRPQSPLSTNNQVGITFTFKSEILFR